MCRKERERKFYNIYIYICVCVCVLKSEICCESNSMIEICEKLDKSNI